MKYGITNIEYYDLLKEMELYGISTRNLEKETGIGFSHLRKYMLDKTIARVGTYLRIKKAVDKLKSQKKLKVP